MSNQFSFFDVVDPPSAVKSASFLRPLDSRQANSDRGEAPLQTRKGKKTRKEREGLAPICQGEGEGKSGGGGGGGQTLFPHKRRKKARKLPLDDKGEGGGKKKKTVARGFGLGLLVSCIRRFVSPPSVVHVLPIPPPPEITAMPVGGPPLTHSRGGYARPNQPQTAKRRGGGGGETHSWILFFSLSSFFGSLAAGGQPCVEEGGRKEGRGRVGGLTSKNILFFLPSSTNPTVAKEEREEGKRERGRVDNVLFFRELAERGGGAKRWRKSRQMQSSRLMRFFPLLGRTKGPLKYEEERGGNQVGDLNVRSGFFSFIAPGQEWGEEEGRQGENEKFFSRARSSLENTKKRELKKVLAFLCFRN